MTDSPYYDPKTFLLEHDLDKEVIQQTLELFEFICGDSDLSVPEDQELKQMFIDTVNKYKDSESISIEAIKEKIAEQGYEYLTEIFNVTDENLRIMAAYLPMIQILKGTKPGLELIFTILNVGFEITEWWQDPTNLEILSYILFVELINQPVSTSVVPRLRKFSREYVYPLLTHITLAITYKLNKTPYIGAVAYSKTALTIWQEFLWLIWSGDSAPENLWTDQKPYQDPITRRSYWQGSKGEELEWDPKTGEITATNLWSSKTDEDDVRVWKFDDEDNLPEDGDLLEWWIEKINLFGKPEESWSTEDKTVEDPIYTYWSPDTASDVDGTIVRVTIIANPSTALVEINGELTYTAAVKKGTSVSYRVYEPSGDYLSQSGNVVPLEDTVLTVSLTQLIAQCTLTLSVLPKNATVTLSTSSDYSTDTSVTSTTEDDAKIISKTVRRGTKLYWKATCDGYYEQSGSYTMDEDIQKAISLELIPYYTFKINATPSNATVKINSQTTNSVTVMTGTTCTWSVSASGYETKSGTEYNLSADKTIDVALVKTPTFTINTSPSNATVVINGSQRRTFTASAGTTFTWSVSATGYASQSGTITMPSNDSSQTIYLVANNYTLTVKSNTTVSVTFSTSGTIISKGSNYITVPYGTSVSYTVKTSDGTGSGSETRTVTSNITRTANFTYSSGSTWTDVIDASGAEGRTYLYKDGSTAWTSGNYAIAGPADARIRATSTISNLGSGQYVSRSNVSVHAGIGSSENAIFTSDLGSAVSTSKSVSTDWIKFSVDSGNTLYWVYWTGSFYISQSAAASQTSTAKASTKLELQYKKPWSKWTFSNFT